MRLTCERRRQVISGILLIAALLLTMAALLKEIDAVHRPAILIDFYPVERNESGEYRFTRPTSHILVPPPFQVMRSCSRCGHIHRIPCQNER